MERARSIGEVAELTGFSVDTLRYYERIGLLKPVPREAGGRRRYRDADLDRIGFIRRAQKMDFTLAEIAMLLGLRDAPGTARPTVRGLAAEKLARIETHICELSHLRDELALLLNLCRAAEDGRCPILDALSD